MSQPSFDPGGFFRFDLSEGTVHTRTGTRVLMLSASAVAPLVAAAVEHGDLTPVRKLGKELGEHATSGLDGPAGQATPEAVLAQAGGIVALSGWGRLGMERWGDALVVRLEEAPSIDDRRLGVAALLGGVFSSMADREVACVPVDDDRFIIVDPAIAEQVWSWTRGGEGVAGIVGRLAVQEGA